MTQFPVNTIVDTASLGSVPALPAVATARQSSATQYVTHPSWSGGKRSFESAGTTRLNQAHWRDAADQSVNVWLQNVLATIRSRAAYEARQNGMILGVINSHADDIVGSDGPTLQVLSDDDAYNTALERAWQDWFAAPTHRPNVSGTMLLKLWIRSLWKAGEFCAQLITLPDAEGPISLRLKPFHPRLLVSPIDKTGDPNVFMGIRFDAIGRPATYYRSKAQPAPGAFSSPLLINQYDPIPPDLMIHEFLVEEEDQARGIPWMNTALHPAADLRDYDDQVQDAARQAADQSGMFYTDAIDGEPWDAPETADVERRTWKMAPPGWKPFVYPASQPPVQYPDYRAERMRELGRPLGMPLFMVRLDSGKSNYAAARMDYQSYGRAIAGIQAWLSGTEKSYGTLNRLVDEVAKEGRFPIAALRRRPEKVHYKWTWPVRPHVDREKEAKADKLGLELPVPTTTVTDVVAARSQTLEGHVATLKREREVFAAAGLISQPPTSTPAPVDENDDSKKDGANTPIGEVKANA